MMDKVTMKAYNNIGIDFRVLLPFNFSLCFQLRFTLILCVWTCIVESVRF